MSRTLLRMKAVPSNAASCKQLITIDIPMVFRWFSSSSLTVPKVPTTIGIIVVLTSHNFCTCNLKSWFLVIFLVPSLWCFALQEQLCRWFCILSSVYQWLVTTVSCLWCSVYLSVWISKSQSMLHLSFSSTGSGWCENHLSSNSIVFNLI